MDGIQGYITKSYVMPQRMNAMRKRHSKHQTFVKRKNSKLDSDVTEHVVSEISEDVVDSSSRTSSTIMTHLSISNSLLSSDVSAKHLPLSNEALISSQISSSTTPYDVSRNNKKNDTLELRRQQKRKDGCKGYEKRRHVMESHFGVNNSLQAKKAFVRASDACLQTARPIVYRSSSTACVSPVRKTNHVSIPILYSNTLINNEDAEMKIVGGEEIMNFEDMKRDMTFQSKLSSPHATSPFNRDNFRNSCIQNVSNENDFRVTNSSEEKKQVYRRRSKSFGTKELLNERPISVFEEQFVSSHDLHNIDKKNSIMNRILGNNLGLGSEITCSPPHSSSGSSNSSTASNGSPQSAASNTNNVNLVTETIATLQQPPDCSGNRLKAAKRKFKNSKKLSKSLHSLIPRSCTGSLSFQHSEDSTDALPQDPVYQSIDKTRHQFQKIEQQAIYLNHFENKMTDSSNNTTTTNNNNNNSNTLHVHQPFTKNKSTKSISTDSLLCTGITPSTKTKTPYSKNFFSIVSRNKFKSLKSLSKSDTPDSCVATKDLWFNKMAQVTAEQKEGTAPNTNIQVSYFDSTSNTDIVSTLSICFYCVFSYN